MRSLSFPRERLPHLLLWLLVLVLVVGANIIAAPIGYQSAVHLEDLPVEQRDGFLRALASLHLDPVNVAWYWIIIGAIMNVISLIMGWLLVRRGQPAGLATYLAIVMLALAAAQYPPGIAEMFPGRPVLQVAVLLLTLIGVSGLFILPLVFPDGRFVPRWTVFIVPYLLGSFALLWKNPGFLESPVTDTISTIALAGMLVGAPIYRYRRVSTPEQRRQTRWVMLGFVIGIPAFFLGDAMMRNIDDTPLGIACLIGFLIFIEIGFNIPFLAVGAAILFHRLFDIDVVLSRTLTWLAMTLAVIGTYIGIVLGIGHLLDSEGSLLLSLLATGLVAVVFQPARARVQLVVDRLIFGERDDPYAVLSRIGHRIEDTLSATELLPQIVRTTAEALRLPYVALFLDRTGGRELVASTGVASPATLQLPLVYQGQALGVLEVARRSPGDAFGAADRRLLEDLARQVGIAAHTVTLADELQRSREAIISSREEERRRLRRDLHDGLGAQLAALIMQTGAIRAKVRPDPEAAERALIELREELKVAVDDVRRLVHGLRPPSLDQLGLTGVLRARLDRLRAGSADREQPGLDVEFVATDPMPPLPAAVEVAAIHIVDEAVTNVVRHARATRLVVSLAHADNTLEIVVSDNGTGFSMDGITPGIGLQSMRERARELGGSWEMSERPGGHGTVITVRLPAPGTTP